MSEKKPVTPPKKAFKYQERYAVVVMCASERDQKQVYERLLAQGYTLKVVSV